MASKKITALPAATSVKHDDLLPKVDTASGATQKATIDQLSRALGISIVGVNAITPNITVQADGSLSFVGTLVSIDAAGQLTVGASICDQAGNIGNGIFLADPTGRFSNDAFTFNNDGSAFLGLASLTNTAVLTVAGLNVGAIAQSLAAKWTIASGANQRAGDLTLIGGSKTIANTTVTANSILLLTRKTSGGTPGTAITYTLNAGVGFTVNSDNVLDTSTFSYLLIEVV